VLTLVNVFPFLERYQVLDCSVEIIAGKIVEEQAQLRPWLLEFKTLAMNGIDSSRDQGECAGATRAAGPQSPSLLGRGVELPHSFMMASSICGFNLIYSALCVHTSCYLGQVFLFHLLLIKISKLMACSV